MALKSHDNSHSKHAAHTKLVKDRGTIDTDLVFWLIQQAIPKLKLSSFEHSSSTTSIAVGSVALRSTPWIL